MFKLRIKRASLIYDLVFNHRVNTLYGDSGTGKTYLIESIREVVKGVYTKDYFITSCFGENSIISPVLGNISPYMLSGGLKTLLTLRHYKDNDYLVDLAFMGQNCMYYLSKILQDKSLKMVCHTYHNSFMDYPVQGICENDGSRCNNAREFSDKLFEWLPKGQERNIPKGYHEGEGLYYLIN